MTFCMFYSVSKQFREHASHCKETPTCRLKKPILQKDGDAIKANGFGEWIHFCSKHSKEYLIEYLISYGIIVSNKPDEPVKKCLWNLNCPKNGVFVLSLFKNPCTQSISSSSSNETKEHENDSTICDMNDETHICPDCELKYPTRMKLKKKLLQSKLQEKVKQHLNLYDCVCTQHVQDYVESFCNMDSKLVTRIFIDISNLHFALQTKEGKERFDNVSKCVQTFQNHVKNSMPVFELNYQMHTTNNDDEKKKNCKYKKKKLITTGSSLSSTKSFTITMIRLMLKKKRRRIIESLPIEKLKYFNTKADCYIFERDVIASGVLDIDE